MIIEYSTELRAKGSYHIIKIKEGSDLQHGSSQDKLILGAAVNKQAVISQAISELEALIEQLKKDF